MPWESAQQSLQIGSKRRNEGLLCALEWLLLRLGMPATNGNGIGQPGLLDTLGRPKYQNPVRFRTESLSGQGNEIKSV